MTRALLLVLVLALTVPAAARAQSSQTTAPPGNSGIDEYLETVPAARGNTRPGQAGRDRALTAAQRARLERLGSDGQTLANAVDAAAPTPKPNTPDRLPAVKAPDAGAGSPAVDVSDAGAGSPAVELSGTAGRSPAAQLRDVATGGDSGNGMGLALPAILLAALVAAVVLVLLRRREPS